VEVALIIAAAGGLLGCFGVVARVDVVRKRERLYKPLSRVPVRV
jgi:hypothetical protein